jgi:hypothetical protein
MPDFTPRLTPRDPPAARVAEALRALRVHGYAGSFVIAEAGDDYVQVAGNMDDDEVDVEATRGAWYQGAKPSHADDLALRALGLAPPAAGAGHHNYSATASARLDELDALAERIWRVLSQAFGHAARALRIEVTLEDELER